MMEVGTGGGGRQWRRSTWAGAAASRRLRETLARSGPARRRRWSFPAATLSPSSGCTNPGGSRKETPDTPSPSRPRRLRPGLTIHRLDGGRFRVSAESRAFPGWPAARIHAALDETHMSPRTLADLTRVGRRLGRQEGTTRTTIRRSAATAGRPTEPACGPGAPRGSPRNGCSWAGWLHASSTRRPRSGWPRPWPGSTITDASPRSATGSSTATTAPHCWPMCSCAGRGRSSRRRSGRLPSAAAVRDAAVGDRSRRR